MNSIERTAPPFGLTAIDLDGDVCELKVEGELDLMVADRLKTAIAEADARAVLVDLSDCAFIDSTGIAVVLRARRDGARVALHSSSDQVHRILSVLGLTGDGLVFAEREEAMSAVARRRARD